MKTKANAILIASSLLLIQIAQATLIDRGSGLIYDDVTNLTWLRDANYAKTSGFDVDGKMDWDTAYNWAQNLTVHDGIRNLDITDWRLPKSNMQFSNGNAQGIEMGYMYYVNLSNQGYYNYDTGGINADYGLKNTGPFINLQSFLYWSNDEVSQGSTRAFDFITSNGGQNANLKQVQLYAWAVREGDVAAVPEPATYVLFLVGLSLLGISTHRSRYFK